MFVYLFKSLGFLGHHASIALPISVTLGLILPSLSEALEPFLIPALLIPLTLSLVRIETKQLFAATKKWKIISLLSLWILVLSPILIYLLLSVTSIPTPIKMAAVIAAAAPPVTACAAIALFLRLDAATTVVITVVTMLLVPITLPPIVYYLADLNIELELWQLSFRLVGFIFTAFLLAMLIKRIRTAEQIVPIAPILDGISVVFISLFIIGVMRGVTDLFLKEPEFVWLTLAVSSGLIFVLYLISAAIFWRLGSSTAMAIGLASGNCNLGLMYLVLSDQAPLELLIFFAIGQIPMYCLPTLLKPLIQYYLKKNHI